MARQSSWPTILSVLTLVGIAGADVTNPPGRGFIGFGIHYYEPACAWACTYAVAAPINCTTADLAIAPQFRRRDEAAATPDYPSGDGWQFTDAATPTCQSRNQDYLRTLAYCMKSYCKSTPVSEIEAHWEENLVKLPDGSLPKSYTEVLFDIKETPTRPINATEPLNYTAIVPQDVYDLHFIDVFDGDMNETINSLFSLILVISAAAIPIATSLLRFLPWPSSWATKFNAYFIDPPLFGSRHAAPVWGFGIMPTRGQAIFIIYLWVLNIAFSVMGYSIRVGTWYSSIKETIGRDIGNRLGVLSYAHVPIVILYAGRNNFLLWVTNWSHSTFILLHRWAAFLCTLHAALHSLCYLDTALHSPGWEEEFTSPYWYWGCAGTIGFVILTIISIQPVRKRIYETFLIAHIVIVVVVIVSSYKHVALKYTDAYGFQNWLWMACAIWGFDRFVRVARWLGSGFKRAYITAIDEDYLRLDIPKVSTDGHVYLHFPTISTWRFWENHPFSIAGTTREEDESLRVGTPMSEEKETRIITSTVAALGSSSGKTENDASSIRAQREPGVTLFIRKQGGLTARLAAVGPSLSGIPVFIEGPYNHRATILQDGHSEPTHRFPNLLCIAGGVGITGALPMLARFHNAGKPLGTRKLYWGARTWPLVREVERMQLGGPGPQDTAAQRRWGDVDVTLSIGERFDLRRVLTEELVQQTGGTVVLVCGPAGMVDEVRCVVSALGRHGKTKSGKALIIKLVTENFSW